MKIIDISNCSDGVIAYINNLQKYIDEKEKEIQDLKQKNDYLNDLEASAVEYKELKSQLQQKENIIKEVREYITYWHYRNDFRINSFTTGVKEELLKILDKEVN